MSSFLRAKGTRRERRRQLRDTHTVSTPKPRLTSSVNSTGSLQLGSESNNRPQSNQSRLSRVLLGLLDRSGNPSVIVVSILDVQNFPSVRLESHLDVLGERTSGVSVNGDLVVVVDGDQVSELQVTGQRGGLGSDTLLQTTVTGEHYRVEMGSGRDSATYATAHKPQPRHSL